MAKQISLMDTLSKFNKKEDKAPKEYIVEVEKDGKEIVEVLTTEDIKQTNPESIKQITPKPFQGDVVIDVTFTTNCFYFLFADDFSECSNM